MKICLPLACLLSLVALPALAYPTSILSIPTAGTLEAGKLHFGGYSSTPYDPASAGLDLSINLGAFDGFDVNGLKMGALEFGFDGVKPEPGSLVSFSGKLSLLGETETIPGIAIGTYYLGVPNLDASPNLLFASLSKSINAGDLSLGSWTAGIVRPSSVVNNGMEGLLLSAGMTYDFPLNLGFAMDFTSGTSAYSYTNVGLYYTPIEDLSFTAGYAFSGDRQNGGDYPFLYVDYTLALGGKKSED